MSEYSRGGFFYVANSNLNIAGTLLQVYDSYAPTNAGGVFLFEKVGTVSLTNS